MVRLPTRTERLRTPSAGSFLAIAAALAVGVLLAKNMREIARYIRIARM